MYQPIVKDVEKNVGGQNYFQVINYQKPSSDTLGFLPDIGKKYNFNVKTTLLINF